MKSCIYDFLKIPKLKKKKIKSSNIGMIYFVNTGVVCSDATHQCSAEDLQLLQQSGIRRECRQYICDEQDAVLEIPGGLRVPPQRDYSDGNGQAVG